MSLSNPCSINEIKSLGDLSVKRLSKEEKKKKPWELGTFQIASYILIISYVL